MSASVNVLSIHALEDLRTALLRFDSEAQEVLNATALEIRRTLDWLAERQGYWQAEVRRRQEVMGRARAALAACRGRGYRDPQTGRYDEPPGTAQGEAVRKAQVHLAEAEAELRNVQHWTRLVQQTAAEYQRQAQRLAALLSTDLPRAAAWLNHKISTLQAYVMMRHPSGSELSPDGALSFTTDVALAVLKVIVKKIVIAAIHWLAGDILQVLGPVGEQLLALLLNEQFDLQEVPSDPLKHGFNLVHDQKSFAGC